MKRRVLAILCGLPLFLAPLRAGAEEDKPYLIPVSLQVTQVEAVLTAGEKVKGFALPESLGGLGAMREGDGTVTLLATHLRAGASAASLWSVRPHPDPEGMIFVVRSGKEAGKDLALAKAGPACAAGAEEGFDPPLFLLGDGAPEGGAAALDGTKALPLPALGRYAKGGLMVLRGTGAKTAVVGLEDTGGEPSSHFYLFVGDKDLSGSAPLEKNGLSKGALFVLRAEGLTGTAQLREKGKKVRVSFVPVRAEQERAGLSREAGQRGAACFAGLSAAVQLPSSPNTLYFASRGSEARDERGRYADHNGRLYRLVLDGVSSPAEGGTLEVALSETDGVISPSALAADKRGRLLVAEAPTFPTPGRDTSVWLFDPASGALVRMLEASPASAGRSDQPGSWAVTGLQEASSILGEDGWWLAAVAMRGSPDGGQIVAVHTNILNIK